MKQVIFFIFITALFLNYAFAEIVKITSNPPDVQIYVKNTSTQKLIKLGKTPFQISESELISNYAKGEIYILELKKVGFDPYRILMSKLGKSNVDLFINMEVKKSIRDIKLIDAYSQELFEIQRLIRVKNYDTAIKKLFILEGKFPHYSVIYEMAGSAFYLNKKFSQSLAYYRKAFSKNTDNIDAYRMKEYLEAKLGLTKDKERKQ